MYNPSLKNRATKKTDYFHKQLKVVQQNKAHAYVEIVFIR